jgi:hypothetical protein
MTTKVQCPTCQKPVTWSAESKWKPFCSERCKLIDLGEWANENHRIKGESVPNHNDDTSGFDYH